MIVIDYNKHTFRAMPASNNNGFRVEEDLAKVNTRPGGINNYTAFRNYLKGLQLLVLGGQTYIEVGHGAWQIDDAHFFVLSYQWSQYPETVHKKLSAQGKRGSFLTKVNFSA